MEYTCSYRVNRDKLHPKMLNWCCTERAIRCDIFAFRNILAIDKNHLYWVYVSDTLQPSALLHGGLLTVTPFQMQSKCRLWYILGQFMGFTRVSRGNERTN